MHDVKYVHIPCSVAWFVV
uniref:Uncharacterized protein n=1 Tax=Steinernema glaseri TaxID=37863 RepID=A0A1I8AIE5_9BILA